MSPLPTVGERFAYVPTRVQALDRVRRNGTSLRRIIAGQPASTADAFAPARHRGVPIRRTLRPSPSGENPAEGGVLDKPE